MGLLYYIYIYPSINRIQQLSFQPSFFPNGSVGVLDLWDDQRNSPCQKGQFSGQMKPRPHTTDFPQKVGEQGKSPAISGKSRLVKYYEPFGQNFPRNKNLGIQSLSCHEPTRIFVCFSLGIFGICNFRGMSSCPRQWQKPSLETQLDNSLGSNFWLITSVPTKNQAVS